MLGQVINLVTVINVFPVPRSELHDFVLFSIKISTIFPKETYYALNWINSIIQPYEVLYLHSMGLANDVLFHYSALSRAIFCWIIGKCTFVLSLLPYHFLLAQVLVFIWVVQTISLDFLSSCLHQHLIDVSVSNSAICYLSSISLSIFQPCSLWECFSLRANILCQKVWSNILFQ